MNACFQPMSTVKAFELKDLNTLWVCASRELGEKMGTQDLECQTKSRMKTSLVFFLSEHIQHMS